MWPSRNCVIPFYRASYALLHVYDSEFCVGDLWAKCLVKSYAAHSPWLYWKYLSSTNKLKAAPSFWMCPIGLHRLTSFVHEAWTQVRTGLWCFPHITDESSCTLVFQLYVCSLGVVCEEWSTNDVLPVNSGLKRSSHKVVNMRGTHAAGGTMLVHSFFFSELQTVMERSLFRPNSTNSLKRISEYVFDSASCPPP